MCFRMFWTVRLEGGPKRVNHAAAKVGHHIYSFGGYNKDIDFEELSPISVYDLNTGIHQLLLCSKIRLFDQCHVFFLFCFF